MKWHWKTFICVLLWADVHYKGVIRPGIYYVHSVKISSSTCIKLYQLNGTARRRIILHKELFSAFWHSTSGPIVLSHRFKWRWMTLHSFSITWQDDAFSLSFTENQFAPKKRRHIAYSPSNFVKINQFTLKERRHFEYSLLVVIGFLCVTQRLR